MEKLSAGQLRRQGPINTISLNTARSASEANVAADFSQEIGVSTISRADGSRILNSVEQLWWKPLISCLALVLLSVFMIRFPHRSSDMLIGYLSLVIFGGGGLFYCIKVIFGETKLELSNNGFSLESFGKGKECSWYSVDKPFGIIRFGSTDFVGFSFSRALNFWQLINKALSGYSGFFPNSFGMSAENLAKLLNDYRDRALGTVVPYELRNMKDDLTERSKRIFGTLTVALFSISLFGCLYFIYSAKTFRSEVLSSQTVILLPSLDSAFTLIFAPLVSLVLCFFASFFKDKTDKYPTENFFGIMCIAVISLTGCFFTGYLPIVALDHKISSFAAARGYVECAMPVGQNRQFTYVLKSHEAKNGCPSGETLQ